MNLVRKIGLGSAQWGMAYGVSNKKGISSVKEVSKILNYAQTQKIRLIDTAFEYGKAESVLGKNNLNNFKVITKSPSFTNKVIKKYDKENLKSSLKDSLVKLNLDSIYGLMIHKANDILKDGSEYLIEGLHELKTQKLVKKIGISIYPEHDLEKIITKFCPDIIQLPINIFDQRLLNNGSLKYLDSLGIEIHARSLFLQGLLLMKEENTPSYFNQWSKKLNEWRYLCKSLSEPPLKIALCYVLNLAYIKFGIIGTENSLQLRETISYLDNPINIDLNYFSCDDKELINPSNWKVK